jgi:acyl carrier protein
VNTLDIIRDQLVRVRGSEARSVTPETLISQVVDSRSFLTLLMNLERALQLTVTDEDFYESAPVTIGQLAEFLDEARTGFQHQKAVNQ